MPILERGRWGAKRAGPVDGGGATHAAALQDGDALVLGLAAGGLLVQRGIGFGLALLEVFAALELAFFDDDDLEAGLGHQFRGDARTRARADDGHVTGDAGGQGAVCTTQYFPTTGEALLDGVR